MTVEGAASTSDRPAVWVDTFRSGLLAALGHDLRLSVERFEIALEQGKITADLDLGSLRVLGAMSRGRLDTSAPSVRDREEIERAIAGILAAARFPTATFTGLVRASFAVEGELRLHGSSQPLSLQVARGARALSTSVELKPSHFGIAPYRALGGALKLQDRVAITATLPIASIEPNLTELSDLARAQARWRRP